MKKKIVIGLIFAILLFSGCVLENPHRELCEEHGMEFQPYGFQLGTGDCVKIEDGTVTKKCEVTTIRGEPFLEKSCIES